jgi:hypothetical protein
MNQGERLRRWRLILGRYSEQALSGSLGEVGGSLTGGDAELDQVLGYLYDREYTERGHRFEPGAGGSLDPSRLTAITWLGRARQLFPRSPFDRMQKQALTDYGLSGLLADREAAAAVEPSPALASALLGMRGKLDANLEDGLRIVITKVVEEIVARLKTSFTAALQGRRDRFRRSFQPRAQNLDWRATLRANLSHYDRDAGRLVIDQVRFDSRARRRLRWDVILCVDQSASMASSVLYAAVCASIMAALPGVDVRLIAFDTSVVDLTAQATDPVGILMTVQLGGGTDIAGALRHCETLVRMPSRTALVLISDFEEGGSVSDLVGTVGRLRDAGVTLLGLGALDEDARAAYDPHVGGLLAARGMEVAAMTPDRLAEWLAEVMG